MRIVPGYASLPARSPGVKTGRRLASRFGPDAQDCKRQLLDENEPTSGWSNSDQYAFPHYCALEATRTQGDEEEIGWNISWSAPSQRFSLVLGH